MNQISKEESTHHNENNEKGDCITSRKELQMSLENSTKKPYEHNDQDESGQELGGDGNKSCTNVQYNNIEERTRIPEITTGELQTAIDKISKKKKNKSPDSNGIRAEDIKACDDETREMVRQNLQRDYKEARIHAWGLEESDDKSDTQERRRGECE